MTLSIAETEWMVPSEALKENMFMIELLRNMKFSVGNFIASHVTTTSQIKHVDTKYKYVLKYVEDGIVKIVFVKSIENDSVNLTRNLNIKVYAKHTEKMIDEKPNLFSRYGSI